MAGELSAAAVHPASAVRGAGRNATAWLLLAPSCLALVLLFVVPIAYVLVLSVTDPQLSLAHYRRIFTVPVYTRVMINTFVTSLIVTALCLVIGYPIAYVMARRAGGMSTVLLTIVAMSFWTGFLVRTYAWLVILGSKGPVAAAYGALGLGQAPQLLFNTFSSTLGMSSSRFRARTGSSGTRRCAMSADGRCSCSCGRARVSEVGIGTRIR